MTTINEVWKPIKGFPDYQVSNTGIVKSTKHKKERILKPSHKRVPLFKDGRQLFFSVRKLMFSTFHDVSLDKLEGVYFLGDSLDTIRPLCMNDLFNEIRTKSHPLMTPEIVERAYHESFNDICMIIEALKTGDVTKLAERILSCKGNTVGYLYNKFRLRKETLEELWSAVSSDIIIRIMKKEIVVRDIQRYINASARNFYTGNIKQSRKKCLYNDEITIEMYK